MQVRHPDAVAGESVDVNGDLRPVEDGTFRVAESESSWLDRWCNRNGFDRGDVVVSESADSDANPTPDAPETAIQNGECPWCSEYEGEHVGQHASSAHPEEWAAYQED